MTWEAWLTLGVITLAVLVLTRDLMSPAVTFMGAVVVLLVADVLTPAEAFQGFANPAPITVAALYVLARAVQRSGALQPIVKVTLGTGRSVRLALARLTVPVAAASAFLNNTPIIAMLAPQVGEWADRRGDSASRYLMPLSFAAILGGMTTLIGTSTNLVVSGLLQAEGYEPFSMFELTRIALPIALVALVVNVLVAPKLLPDRIPPRVETRAGGRSFSVRMIVEPGGPLDGKPVAEVQTVLPETAMIVYFERDGEGAGQIAPNRRRSSIGLSRGLTYSTNSRVTSDPEGAIQVSGTSRSAFATDSSGVRNVSQRYGSDETRRSATITPPHPATAASTAALPQRWDSSESMEETENEHDRPSSPGFSDRARRPVMAEIRWANTWPRFCASSCCALPARSSAAPKGIPSGSRRPSQAMTTARPSRST